MDAHRLHSFRLNVLPPEAEIVLHPTGGVDVLVPLLGKLYAAAAIQHQRPGDGGILHFDGALKLLRGLVGFPFRHAPEMHSTIPGADDRRPASGAGDIRGAGERQRPAFVEQHDAGDIVVPLLHLGGERFREGAVPGIPGKTPVGVAVTAQDLSACLHTATRPPGGGVIQGGIDNHVRAGDLAYLAGSLLRPLAGLVELDPPDAARGKINRHWPSAFFWTCVPK